MHRQVICLSFIILKFVFINHLQSFIRKLAFANQAPKGKDEDEQKLPSKLREMMDLKNKLQKERIDAKKKKESKQKLKTIVFNKPDEKGAEIPLKPVPEIKKNEAESESAFLNRVDRVILV